MGAMPSDLEKTILDMVSPHTPTSTRVIRAGVTEADRPHLNEAITQLVAAGELIPQCRDHYTRKDHLS